MSRVYNFKGIDSLTRPLRINPEGWTEDLVFEVGFLSRCGQAQWGMGVRIGDKDGGGVFTNDDLLAIQEAILNHFQLLNKQLNETKAAPIKPKQKGK